MLSGLSEQYPVTRTGRNERTAEDWLEAILHSGQVTRVAQHLALVIFHIADEKGVAAISMRELERITGWSKSTLAAHLAEIKTFIDVTLGRGRGRSTFALQGMITEAVVAIRSVQQPDAKSEVPNDSVHDKDATAATKHSVHKKDAIPDATLDKTNSVQQPNSTPDTKPRSVQQPDAKPRFGGGKGGENYNYCRASGEEDAAAVAALHRKAFELGERIKGGKAAKSQRAVRASQGDLDGREGIKFENGKLTVFNGARQALAADFPGVNLDAVLNKVAPEIAKNRYPSVALAMSLIRKWAQFAVEDSKKASASPMGRDDPQAKALRELQALARGPQ